MNKVLQLEIVWWIFTAVATLLVLYPILSSVGHYPFLTTNIVYVVTFITLSRYVFLLRHTFLAYRQSLKVILFFLCVPLVFFLVQELNAFQTFLDEEGPGAVLGNLPHRKRDNLIKYVQSEMLLFGTGSIISGVLFPLRLLVSVWRYRNRGTV